MERYMSASEDKDDGNLHTEDDVQEYLAFLKRVREEVENWPEYMKQDGYVVREWRLGRKDDKTSV